jgi:hypothetical protein
VVAALDRVAPSLTLPLGGLVEASDAFGLSLVKPFSMLPLFFAMTFSYG